MTSFTIGGLVSAAADAQTKSANGAEGLVVFLFLALAVFFLLRSMLKHLRKVKRIDFDESEPPLTGPDVKR
jgi:hypothetical protein